MKRFVIVAVVVMIALAVQAQEIMWGTLDDATPSITYEFEFEAGQTVFIRTEATSGDLDTVLSLRDRKRSVLAENDDINISLNSALVYTITQSGLYYVVVERYEPGSSGGDFQLTVTTGDESLFDELEAIRRVQLSGPRLTYDTPNFRLHYTLQGRDLTTEAYVEALGAALEDAWTIQIDQLGWPAPPPDGDAGGDGRYDVYITGQEDKDSFEYGSTWYEDIIGDNPATAPIEAYGSTSYFIIDNDFAEISESPDEALGLMQATVAHEFHHAIQFGYDYADAHSWYYEATAAWMETQTFPDVQDATPYVAYNYDYPELCFGTVNDPAAGLLQYGEWMFIQSLVDAHGTQVVFELWDQVALTEGFTPLADTLAAYDETIPQALARYRAQNLARAYEMAPLFEATVWLEVVIDQPGDWTFTGEGIQELGANYFYFKPGVGVYTVSLGDAPESLTLWLLRVADGQLEAVPLGREASFDTAGSDYLYLMVFNTAYDDEVNDCIYYDYSITVTPGGAASVIEPLYLFDAAHFEPLRK